MDPHLIWFAVAALGGGIATGALCRWHFRRKLKSMQHRLEQADQSCRTEHERALQMRTQINQLSQAMADLQRRHRSSQEAYRRRTQLEELVPSSPEGPAAPPQGFADTQPL